MNANRKNPSKSSFASAEGRPSWDKIPILSSPSEHAEENDRIGVLSHELEAAGYRENATIEAKLVSTQEPINKKVTSKQTGNGADDQTQSATDAGSFVGQDSDLVIVIRTR